VKEYTSGYFVKGKRLCVGNLSICETCNNFLCDKNRLKIDPSSKKQSIIHLGKQCRG